TTVVLGYQHLAVTVQGQPIGAPRGVGGQFRALRQAAPAYDPLVGNIAEEQGGAPPHRPFGKPQAARNPREEGLGGNKRVQVRVAYVQRDLPASSCRLRPHVMDTTSHGETADG